MCIVRSNLNCRNKKNFPKAKGKKPNTLYEIKETETPSKIFNKTQTLNLISHEIFNDEAYGELNEF